MTRTRMLKSIGGMIAALGLCLGAEPAYANNGNTRLQGTWDVLLTVRNCATGDALTSIRELATFDHAGTVVSATSGLPPATKTSGHGTWRHVTDHTYSYVFKFFRFDAAGALIGWTIIRQEATVDTGGNEYTSVGGAEVYNTTGTLIASGCSTTVSTRFE